MCANVIVLNADYMFINTVSWQKAVKLVLKNKAEIVKASDDVLNTFEEEVCHVPLVVRLLSMVKILFTKKVIFTKANVFLRDGYICAYCGKKITTPTIDHIVPVSKGGKTSWVNCITSCKSCNNKKGDKLLKDFGVKLCKKPYEPSFYDMLKLYMNKHNINLDSIFRGTDAI